MSTIPNPLLNQSAISTSQIAVPAKITVTIPITHTLTIHIQFIVIFFILFVLSANLFALYSFLSVYPCAIIPVLSSGPFCDYYSTIRLTLCQLYFTFCLIYLRAKAKRRTNGSFLNHLSFPWLHIYPVNFEEDSNITPYFPSHFFNGKLFHFYQFNLKVQFFSGHLMVGIQGDCLLILLHYFYRKRLSHSIG